MKKVSEATSPSNNLYGVGSSPTLATCETSQVLLAGLSGGFSRFRPTY